MEGTDNGTDGEKRKTSILEIVAAYESERNEKLVDVQCCADIPPCFTPPLSTQVLASGMQIYPRGAIVLSPAIAGEVQLMASPPNHLQNWRKLSTLVKQ